MRYLCMVVQTKLELREALRELRRGAIAFPAKESLLVEATPDGTAPEEGQRGGGSM